MRNIITLLLAAAGLTLGAFSALAGPQPPFTEDELLRCIEDTPAFVDYMEDLGEAMDSSGGMLALKDLGARADAQAWFRKNGWTRERWAYVLDHMGRGYGSAMMDQNTAEMPKPQEIDLSGLPPEMQEQMRAQIAASMAMGQAMAAQQAKALPPSEMVLIGKHHEGIREMFDSLE